MTPKGTSIFETRRRGCLTTHLREKKIAFVGAGAIAEALIKGMCSTGVAKPERIFVINRNRRERLDFLARTYGVQASTADVAVDGADVVVLCPKPADMTQALADIARFSAPDALYISVAAGCSIGWIQETLSPAWRNPARGAGSARPRVARTMPNTSCAVLESATGYAMGENCTLQDAEMVHEMFGAVGTAYALDEEQMNAVTGLSGSGPAYVYYLVESLIKAGVAVGLDEDTAAALVVQTLVGAAAMLRFSAQPPAVLRERVTSPGGTTMAGIAALQELGFADALREAVTRATARAGQMGEQLSQAQNTQNK